MTAPFYLVLHNDNDKVQTIGPVGAKFASFQEADAYAKRMRDQYVHQSFIVAQATGMYQTRVAGTVMRFEADEKDGRRTMPKRRAARGMHDADKNVVQMPARKSGAQASR